MSLLNLFKASKSPWKVPEPTGPRWVPAGGGIRVGDRTVAGGLVYVGDGLESVKGHGIEPSLVNPSLAVNWDKPDWIGANFGYWPSYDTISPRARAAYLKWLDGGRVRGDIGIGYVFLFFYGLERRFLTGLGSDISAAETDVLVTEVVRLLGLYGDNRSFAGYATRFLEFVEGSRLVDGPEQVELPVWDPDRVSVGVPPAVLLGVGRYVGEGLPVPAGWALSYLRHHPDYRLRVPAVRCHAEFDELFKIRYGERFGDGMWLRAPSGSLRFSYQPASAGFDRPVVLEAESVPDVQEASGSLNPLKSLAEECSDELASYSRAVASRQNLVSETVGLLPGVLLVSSSDPTVAGLRDWLSKLVGDRRDVKVGLDELVSYWSPDRSVKLLKRDAAGLASMLGKLGFGMEPDVRFGSPTPKPGSDVFVFRLPDGSPSGPSVKYSVASVLTHLTAAVAKADGAITEGERNHLFWHLEKNLELSDQERFRLDVCFRWLGSTKVGVAGLRSKVKKLPTKSRVSVGDLLLAAASSDGVVTAEEVDVLTKVFGYLGLDPAVVYRRVPRTGLGVDEPVTVRDSDPPKRWGIPPADTDPGESVFGVGSVGLDPEKVKARLEETARVAALLTDIFDDTSSADDSESGVPESGVPVGSDDNSSGFLVEGLDVAHSGFVAAVLERGEWSREELGNLAIAAGLPFLDGAVDVVNEAMFDLCDEPLLEGWDPVEVNPYATEVIV